MTKKFALFAALALAGLIGCDAAPLSTYEHFKAGKPWMNFAYKTGSTFQSLNQDITNCKVEAVQRVPQQQVVRTTPSYTTNTQTFCNRIGTQTICNTSGGNTIGGQVYSVDANSELREQVYHQCMANKNYRYVNLPSCPEGITFKSENGKGLLPLSQTTCYRAFPNNAWEIGSY